MRSRVKLSSTGGVESGVWEAACIAFVPTISTRSFPFISSTAPLVMARKVFDTVVPKSVKVLITFKSL